MSKTKVLHIFSCLGMGGAETWLLDALKCINQNEQYRNNLQFDFLLVGDQENSVLLNEFVSEGAKIHYANFSIGNFGSFAKKYRALLKKENYTAIHSHLDFISGWIFLASLGLAPKNRISHLHNPILNIKGYINEKWYRTVSYYVGRMLTFIFSKKMIGTSKRVMTDYGYHKFPYKMKNFGPLYCGIDVSRFYVSTKLDKASILHDLGFESSVKHIAIFVGRIDLDDAFSINQKNPEFALKTAIELVTNNPKWGFLFVGKKGDQAVQFENQLAAQNLQNKVVFAGIRKDINILMNVSDVMVFPALSEGLGMVAVEAQASGLPVIASEFIPQEACVVDQLFIRKSLDVRISVWVQGILSAHELEKKPKEDYYTQVQDSDFSIQNSVKNLHTIYTN